MNNPDYIPKAKDEFHEWVGRLLTRLLSSLEEWGIPAAAYNGLRARFEVYDAAYQSTLQRANSTPIAIAGRNVLAKDLKAAVRVFVKAYLRYNPAITPADLETLGLPVYTGKRHPAPVPGTQPEFKIDTSMNLQLTVHFHDSGSTRKAKPAGVHGAEVKWAFKDTSPKSYDELIYSTFDTHSPITITFDLADRGKMVWMALRWENTRGRKGPWSMLLNAIVP